jgi:hypothetical protein
VEARDVGHRKRGERRGDGEGVIEGKGGVKEGGRG